METKNINAIIEKNEFGYGVFLEELDGITGFGITLDKAKGELVEVIKEYTDYCNENKIEVEPILNGGNLNIIYKNE